MKKMVIVRILVSVVILGVLIAAYMFLFKNKIKFTKHEPLNSYEQSYGGDMNGSYRSTKIKKIDEENALVSISEAEWHSQEPVVSEYYVPASLMKKIETTFDDHGVYSYNNLPDLKTEVLDAGTTSYDFIYEDGESVNFSDHNMIPKKGMEGIKEIDKMIEKAIKNSEKLPGLVLEDTDQEYAWGRRGRTGVHVYTYREGVLGYMLMNNEDYDILFNGDAILYKLDGEKKTEICSDEQDSPPRVSPEGFEEFSIVPEKRLEAGKYVMTFGEYEEEFEIK